MLYWRLDYSIKIDFFVAIRNFFLSLHFLFGELKIKPKQALIGFYFFPSFFYVYEDAQLSTFFGLMFTFPSPRVD